MDTAPDPFKPADVTWLRVSPQLAWARRVSWCVPALLATVAWWALSVMMNWVAGYAGAAACLLFTGWIWWWAGRQASSWGYAERQDDLLVRHGLMFREMVVVPYGRMQFVDVAAGPVDRVLGIARVRLHTASAHTDAAIPGLPAAEAARLCDRLAARGEAHRAGL